MSWQCPYCETVNQDAVPICTVCDHIAPVITSFLSLEEIDNAREYSEKLARIHQLENDGNYSEMLSVCMEAISLYKANDVALSKAQQAIQKLVEQELADNILSLLNEIKDSTPAKADAIIDLCHMLGINSEDIDNLQVVVRQKIDAESSKQGHIRTIVHLVLDQKVDEALRQIDEAIKQFPAESEIFHIRDKVECLKNTLSKRIDKPSKYPKVSRTNPPMVVPTNDGKSDMHSNTELGQKRKFPKIKR